MSYLLLIPILLPILGGLAMYFLRPGPNSEAYVSGSPLERRLRALVMTIVVLTSAAVWACILLVGDEDANLFNFTNELQVVLRLDNLGRIFAGLVSVLWPITTLYALDYMAHDGHRWHFYPFFIASFGVTFGIAASGNLVTMYCFYELLTLVTLPLVLHPNTHASNRAGRSYLAFSIGGAAFAFMGMVFLLPHGAQSEFALGGILDASDASWTRFVPVIFIFMFFGFGVKAALFPLHVWLPKAAVAPTPVTALLHAVAVVKAGAFAIIRLIYYVCGTDLLAGSWAQTVAICVAAFTMLYGSTMALKQGHWKRRLAYSTVSNLSYIVFAASLMTPAGMAASLLHLLAHAFIKILAFFCAGAVLHYTGREYIDELDGIGRKMPVTFACFAVSALALTGIPLFNGFVSKWNILLAVPDAALTNPAAFIGGGALLISAILTALYMITTAVRAFFPSADFDAASLSGVREAGWRMLVPMVILAAVIIITGLYATPFVNIAQTVAGI